MPVSGYEYLCASFAVLRMQLIYPPLRIAVFPFRLLCGLLQQYGLVAQKIAQYRVRQTAHARTQGMCGAHRMIDHRMLRRLAVLQLIQRDQQQEAHPLVRQRLVQQHVQHRLQLPEETQRAVTQILQRSALRRRPVGFAAQRSIQYLIEIAPFRQHLLNDLARS